TVISQGIHFITANVEMDSTVGFAVDDLAKKHGVVYSISDGDQPGVLSRMIDEVQLYGFEITVAGNCKTFIDMHQNPEGVMPWVRPGHNPRMITAFADGTKQGMELAVLGNGIGLTTDLRGMHGIKTTKKTIVDDFLAVIRQEGIVDYAMGFTTPDDAGGVFVIGKRKEEYVADDLDYLKKGKGPYYLFFRDYHLCYFESAKSISEAVIFGISGLAHKQKLNDVFALAKKELKAGDRLDGIGGFTAYGIIDKAETVKREGLVPMGLTEGIIVKRDLKIDTPITFDDVDFDKDKLVIKLRKKEEDFMSAEG
ncbi:MAG: hypothetical protein HQ547_03410, partial [Candidatus Omnitrophica bacterium]|nr:hypothetical protein [Candidatus Omnitrophota bacterium]